ncbi:glycosyltransferase [Nonomuraea sp. NPDC005501]|uniref:glycosyltransferase n=1 Tax=Nonomuraea sp. NPDC005501 TaxID=3156884 RepID=UPI0033BC6E3B
MASLRRVVLLINELGLGGTEAQVSLLAEGLLARDIETHVIALHRGGPYADRLCRTGVHVHELGFGAIGASPAALLANLRAVVRLVRLLRGLRPQVLHAFLYASYVLGAPAARLARVPVVVAGRRSQSLFKRGRRWVFALETLATRLTHHVVANATAVAQDARATERVPARKLSVIHNGLPDSAFDPVAPEHVDTPFPVLLCVANLHQAKGHRFLLEAAALLGRRGRPCTLVLVGDGPERAALEKQAADLGVDARFHGFRLDTAPLLPRADAVVMPSLTEGMSNAVMEAMAAGRPVVATAVGGTPELLGETRGVLVPAYGARPLADAVLALLDDPARAASLGAAARDWAREHLGVEAMVGRHVDLYQRLLAEDRCAE